MLLFQDNLRRIITTSLAVWLVSASDLFAGWMGFRNDTGQTIVVQETYPNGRLARPQKLFVNETIRETPPQPGMQRRFTIYDANKPDTILTTGTFVTPAVTDNIMYVIKMDRRGNVTVEAVQSPANKK